MKLKDKRTPFKMIIIILPMIMVILIFFPVPVMNKLFMHWQGLIGSALSGFLSIYAVHLTYKMQEKIEDRKNKEKIKCRFAVCNIFDTITSHKFCDNSKSIEIVGIIEPLISQVTKNHDYIVENLQKINELVVEVKLPIEEKEDIIYNINTFINTMNVFNYIDNIHIEYVNEKSILKFKNRKQYNEAKTLFNSLSSINYYINKK